MLKNIIKFGSHVKACRGQIIVPPSRSYVRKGRDPGISHRLKLFSENQVESDPDLYENLDSDFMNVGAAHKDFEKEERQFKENVSSWIVRQKYFKEKGHNFLTWSEKEQLRILYQQDPQEWTPEKLSEAFPADPWTISKIIKNKWQPRDEIRIERHDEAVKNNWKKFQCGELAVEPVLKDHLKKFVKRDFNEIRKKKTVRKLGTEIPKPTSNEFSSIITSCKKYAVREAEVPRIEPPKDISFPTNVSSDPEQDSVMMDTSKPRTMKTMPLEEYKRQSGDIIFKKHNVEEVAQVERDTIPDVKTIVKRENFNPGLLKFEDKKVFERLAVTEHIKIPKSVWKEGSVYKLSDCFYDDSGEFLYRVPGLK